MWGPCGYVRLQFARGGTQVPITDSACAQERLRRSGPDPASRTVSGLSAGGGGPGF